MLCQGQLSRQERRGRRGLSLFPGKSKSGAAAFKNCAALTDIVLGSGVERIGDAAFENTALERVFYKGTEEEWNAIDVGDGNAPLLSAERYCFRADEPAKTADGTAYIGKYWRYVGGVPAVWEITA